MENHAHKLIFIGWSATGARIYAMGKVPHSMQGTGYVPTDEEVANDVEKQKQLLLSQGGMLDDGSGWEGCRIPFTNQRPTIEYYIELRNKVKGNPT